MASPGIHLNIEVTHDLGAFSDRTRVRIRRGAMLGAKRFEARAKLEYRQDVRRAGLGDRLANTCRIAAFRDYPCYPRCFVSAVARTGLCLSELRDAVLDLQWIWTDGGCSSTEPYCAMLVPAFARII
jgi:hypothetical protein